MIAHANTHARIDLQVGRQGVCQTAIDEASAKIRTGPPLDDEDDYAMRCWAGVMPLQSVAGEAIPDARLPKDIPVPDYARKFPRRDGK